MPKINWILDWEKESIVNYAKAHLGEGYRRLTYIMFDEDIVAVSYRVLKIMECLIAGKKSSPNQNIMALSNLNW